jgi:hypothetical protein
MASLKVVAEAFALPAGPVDFDALCAALKAGKSAQEAVEAATKDNPVPEQVTETEVAATVIAETNTAAPAAAFEKE